MRPATKTATTVNADAAPPRALILEVAGHRPAAEPSSWVAPGATLAGQVVLHEDVGVFYGCVLRSEGGAPVTVGPGSNVQDGTVMHADPGFPLTIGRGVTVGHAAMLHGATIGDDVLVGMRATVLNGAVVGAGSLVAAGAVVLEGTQVPPGSLVAGVPAKVRRALTAEEIEGIRRSAATYQGIIAAHREARETTTAPLPEGNGAAAVG